MSARLGPQRRFTSIAATSVAFIVLVSLAGGSRAHAQSAAAERLFNDGDRLMSEGKLAQACDAFEASNAIEPVAGTLILLGQCREQLQQLASAWSAYKAALTRAKDPRKRAFAAARTTALEPRLSHLTVSVPEASRIDGLTLTRNGAPLDPTLWNRPLPVDGGDQVIAGRAPGREPWQTTAYVAVERAEVSVEVPKLEVPKLEVRRQPPSSPAPAFVISDHLPTRSTGMFTTRRKIAVGTAAASAIALTAGVVLGVTAKHRQDDAHALCSDPQVACDGAERANALVRSGHNFAIGADVAFGISAAAAIATGVLWFTGAQESPGRIAIAPAVLPDQVVITARRSF